MRKFKMFLGAALSVHPHLFEHVNGYPNSFEGWGGEDDALVKRLELVCEKNERAVTYTVPPQGRLIDLEIAQPVTLTDKLSARVKELQKFERLETDKTTWHTNGIAQVMERISEASIKGHVDKTLLGNVIRVPVTIIYPNTDMLQICNTV